MLGGWALSGFKVLRVPLSTGSSKYQFKAYGQLSTELRSRLSSGSLVELLKGCGPF